MIYNRSAYLTFPVGYILYNLVILTQVLNPFSSLSLYFDCTAWQTCLDSVSFCNILIILDDASYTSLSCCPFNLKQSSSSSVANLSLTCICEPPPRPDPIAMSPSRCADTLPLLAPLAQSSLRKDLCCLFDGGHRGFPRSEFGNTGGWCAGCIPC